MVTFYTAGFCCQGVFLLFLATHKNMKLAKTFCSCVKKVQKGLVLRPLRPSALPRRRLTRKEKAKKEKGARESAAIAICVKSVLQTRGRTLKKFRCLGGPRLTTKPKATTN